MKILKTRGLIISFALLLVPVSSAKCQAFDFQLITDTVEYEFPGGSDILLRGNIINTGTIDLNIDIIRAENNLPLNWQSYMCTDVCYSPTTDSSRLYLTAGDTQSFYFSFIISTLPDTGDGLILFKNVTDVNNNFSQRFYGIATPYAGINNNTLDANIQLYPNPVTDKLMITTDWALSELELYNIEGKNVLSIGANNSTNFSIDMSNFQAGTYFLKAIDKNGKMINKKIIKIR